MEAYMKDFDQLMEEFSTKNIVEKAIDLGKQRYHLKPYDINEINPKEARDLYSSILEKFYKSNEHDQSKSWYENQLRLFIWTLICYLFIKDRALEDMTSQQWEYFQLLFPKKDPRLFEYQSRALFHEKTKVKNSPWEKAETEFLRDIVEHRNDKMKWNQISKELFFRSNKSYFRTAKQCRQRWLNHEDPSKKRGKWTAHQCLKMFQYVQQHDKKWAGLVNELGKSRNEHAIKNKFNSLMKKQRKKMDIPENDDKTVIQAIIGRIKNTLNNSGHKSHEESFDIDDNIQIQPVMKERVAPTKREEKPENFAPRQNFSIQSILTKLKGYQVPKKSTNPIQTIKKKILARQTSLVLKQESAEKNSAEYILQQMDKNKYLVDESFNSMGKE